MNYTPDNSRPLIKVTQKEHRKWCVENNVDPQTVYQEMSDGKNTSIVTKIPSRGIKGLFMCVFNASYLYFYPMKENDYVEVK